MFFFFCLIIVKVHKTITQPPQKKEGRTAIKEVTKKKITQPSIDDKKSISLVPLFPSNTLSPSGEAIIKSEL